LSTSGWRAVEPAAVMLPVAHATLPEAGGATDAPPPLAGDGVALEPHAAARSPARTTTALRRRFRSINCSSSSADWGAPAGVLEPTPTELGHVATPALSSGWMNRCFVDR